MPFEQRELTLDISSDLQDGRADRGVQHLVGGSRAHVTGLFDHDCVMINEQIESNPGRRLCVGDRLVVRYETNRRYSPRRRPRQVHSGFSIVYEDAHIIVVEKAAELLTVPTDAREANTLQSRVNEHVRHEGHGKGAFVVHRLDRGVSGLLVFGKTRNAARELQEQFRNRKPARQYEAVVAGQLELSNGTFRTFLTTDKNLTRHSSDCDDEGELAITHFHVLRQLTAVTHVAVQLETGRRNQIRVHFAEARHPVIGDQRYRSDLWKSLPWPWKRLALHASLLGFTHPFTQQPLRFDSALPREMLDFLKLLETDGAPRRPPKSRRR